MKESEKIARDFWKSLFNSIKDDDLPEIEKFAEFYEYLESNHYTAGSLTVGSVKEFVQKKINELMDPEGNGDPEEMYENIEDSEDEGQIGEYSAYNNVLDFIASYQLIEVAQEKKRSKR